LPFPLLSFHAFTDTPVSDNDEESAASNHNFKCEDLISKGLEIGYMGMVENTVENNRKKGMIYPVETRHAVPG